MMLCISKKTIEYKLRTTVKDRKALLKLLDKGKSVYNLALSECKKRLNKIRTDKEYIELLAKRKGLWRDGASLSAINAQLAKIVKDRYGLTKNDIESTLRSTSATSATVSTRSLRRCWRIEPLRP